MTPRREARREKRAIRAGVAGRAVTLKFVGGRSLDVLPVQDEVPFVCESWSFSDPSWNLRRRSDRS